MDRWKLGEAEIEALIASGELQKLTSEAANGERLLEKASVTLETARWAVERDPRLCVRARLRRVAICRDALLAHRGLRPTTKGGHDAVERVVRAQFGRGLRQFGALRGRRDELEYPRAPR